MEMSEPNFYYLLRHPNGEVIGTHQSQFKYGENAMLGAYRVEQTTRETVETLVAFGAVEDITYSADEAQKELWYNFVRHQPKELVSKP